MNQCAEEMISRTEFQFVRLHVGISSILFYFYILFILNMYDHNVSSNHHMVLYLYHSLFLIWPFMYLIVWYWCCDFCIFPAIDQFGCVQNVCKIYVSMHYIELLLFFFDSTCWVIHSIICLYSHVHQINTGW